MKYVMFSIAGGKVPIIFSKMLRHDVVASYMRRPINDTFNDSCEPTSAGFVDIEKCYVYGESESLKLKSDPTDIEEILKDIH